MADWAIHWNAAGTIAAILFGLVGLRKIVVELRRISAQTQAEIAQRKHQIEESERSQKLKRTEFFLSQHRRLFDTPDLFDVLSLLDDDAELLAEPEMWDKKRKLLTFFEEIALLVKSQQVDRRVAYYMFGYYVDRAIHGDNFAMGIHPSPEHWGLLYEFAEHASEYRRMHPNGPPADLTL